MDDGVIETRQFGDLTLRVSNSEFGEDPREWDNLGIMLCGRRRYRLGDDIKLPGGFWSWYDDWDHVRDAYIRKEYEVAVILPVYMLDHSGLTVSVQSFNDPWDSGQIGWIFATKDRIREAYGLRRVSPKALARAERALRHEVEAYDLYLRGEFYDGEVVRDVYCDACERHEEVVVDAIGGVMGPYDQAVEYMIQDCFAHILLKEAA